LAAVLGLAGAWLLMNTLRLRGELTDARTVSMAQREREQELKRQIAAERAQGEQLTAELESAREQLRIATEHSTPGVITLLLSSGLLREGDKQNTFLVPPSTEFVQIQLQLKSRDYPAYQATVKTAEGRPVWNQKQLRAKGVALSLRAPARLFPTGDYILTVSGVSAAGEVEEVSHSYFRIVKR